tara:strand:- start:1853 stop:2527 length:675 start_codon:yes stop_codon:yes gene_type:complete
MKKKINRFERKWILKNGDYLKLINSLLRSNFFFTFQYPKRKVNSIYFDDQNLTSIRENLDGISNKRKIRIRWYGNSKKLISPVLEIKSKKGHETKKESFRINKLDNFEYLNPGNLEIIANEVTKITKSKKIIFPLLTTNYEREYFISNHNEIRATVDYNLESIFLKNQSEMNQKKRYFPECILELKYSTKIDKLVRGKLDEITLRLSKNSKYINSFFKKAYYYI